MLLDLMADDDILMGGDMNMIYSSGLDRNGGNTHNWSESRSVQDALCEQQCFYGYMEKKPDVNDDLNECAIKRS